MQIYRINWNRFVILNTPNELRKVKYVKYLISFFEAIKKLYSLFRLFRIQQLYEAEINGQTIQLERVLNDVYDPTERRIYITDGGVYTPPIFYDFDKNRPVIFAAEGATNPIFYSDINIEDAVAFNFFVHVPEDIFFQKDRMKATVTKYKNISRTFDIVII